MQPSQQKQNHYFREAEVVLLVEHQDNLTAEQVIQELGGEFRDGNFSKTHPKINVPRVYTFARSKSSGWQGIEPSSQGQETRFFSLVFGNVPAAKLPDLARSNEVLLERLAARTGNMSLPTRGIGATPKLQVRGVSPNWYSAGAQSKPLGGGGPGAWPVAVPAPPESKSSIVVTGLKGRKQDATAGKVEILVLDTAPPQARLAGSAGKPSHTFKVTRAGDIKPYLGDLMDELNDHALGSDIEGHQYDMADHGLFVSYIADGVLNEHLLSGANANIHLIEVLNQWGVGTVETIVAGLHKAWEIAAGDPNTPRVLNCSFMMLNPRRFTGADAGAVDKDKKGRLGHNLPTDKQAFITKVARTKMLEMSRVDANGDTSSSIILRMIFDLLKDMGVLIVAASGNDAEQPNERPAARYPAAYKSVVGVAALAQTGTSAATALYSNRADEDESDGFATYGGDVKVTTNINGAEELVTDANNALIGPYTAAKVPDPTKVNGTWDDNTTKWIRWAGTSFAAPIISASLAVLLSEGYSPQVAVTKVRNFQSSMTSEGEEVVSIEGQFVTASPA